MKYTLHLGFSLVLMILGCTISSNLPKDTVYPLISPPTKTPVFQKIIESQWNNKISDTYQDDIELDTIIQYFDSLGKEKARVLVNHNVGDLYIDSIVYFHKNRDTLPDWISYVFDNSVAKDTIEATHYFDSLSRIKEEKLVFYQAVRHSKNKFHRYDDSNRHIGFKEFYSNGNLSEEQQNTYIDTLGIVIKNRKSYQFNGDTIAQYIDTILTVDNQILKIIKWTDWENRKYYYKPPRCYICSKKFQYDNKGRVVFIEIESYEDFGKATISYKYDEDLIEKIEIVGVDTTFYRFEIEKDEYGNRIEKKEFKDNVLQKYSRRKIVYWD